MPIRNHIEAIVNTLPGDKTFLYGTANEINVTADSSQNLTVVCLYPLQPIEIKPGKNGSAHNSFDIYMEFMTITKFEKDTADNEPLVAAMLEMANRFVIEVDNYRVNGARYFKWPAGAKQTALPIYYNKDVNMCGVNLRLKLERRIDANLLDC